jgi:hypothetical protein
LEPRCAPAEPLYALVLDLESTRSYLPAELYYLQPPPPRLTLAVPGGAPLTLTWAQTRAAFLPNSDSQEVVLGLAFARAAFREVVYDARTSTVGVYWQAAAAPLALRWLVSVLICAQGVLVVRWINSRNFASMRVLLATRTAGASGELLPFDMTQALYETAALLLSTLTLGLTARYIDAADAMLYAITVAQWGLHAAMSGAVLALTHAATRRAFAQVLQPFQAATTRTPAGVTEPVPARYAIARNALHVFVLANGILMGLLLSSDSVIIMFAAIGIAALLLYHLAYYTAIMIVASFVLRRAPAGAQALWTVYAVFELGAYAAVVYSTQQFLIVAVFESINSFYPRVVLNLFGAAIVISVTLAGVYSVFTDATHTSLLDEASAAAPTKAT